MKFSLENHVGTSHLPKVSSNTIWSSNFGISPKPGFSEASIIWNTMIIDWLVVTA